METSPAGNPVTSDTPEAPVSLESRRNAVDPEAPKMKRRAWADEAMRTNKRYNHYRGLTVAECVEEIEPFFDRTKVKEPKLVVFQLYRELNQGLFCFQGDKSKHVPISPKYYLPEKYRNMTQNPAAGGSAMTVGAVN